MLILCTKERHEMTDEELENLYDEQMRMAGEMQKDILTYLQQCQKNNPDILSDGACIVALTRAIRSIMEVQSKNTQKDPTMQRMQETCALLFTTGMKN